MLTLLRLNLRVVVEIVYLSQFAQRTERLSEEFTISSRNPSNCLFLLSHTRYELEGRGMNVLYPPKRLFQISLNKTCPS